ncbi:hypothetical protein [Streptomyces triculaminicus]|uniref:hypothetical protein n=1 Tax=Streptomyces triculaminicus TaxID=2816232 RepID=UPI0037D4E431
MLRLRLKVIDWPRRALALTDTPRPDCPNCRGQGGTNHDYGDHNGEYAGTEWGPCPYWDWDRYLVLLPLLRRPRWTHPRDDDRAPWGPAGTSDEPPF